MAVTPTPIYPQALISASTQFTDATSTSTPTQILAAQTNGAKIEAIIVSSNDTSNRDINLYLRISSTDYFIGCVQIPLGAGTINTVPAVNLLSALTGSSSLIPLPRDANGNPYLYLDANTSLRAAPGATLTTAKLINLHVIGGSF